MEINSSATTIIPSFAVQRPVLDNLVTMQPTLAPAPMQSNHQHSHQHHQVSLLLRSLVSVLPTITIPSSVQFLQFTAFFLNLVLAWRGTPLPKHSTRCPSNHLPACLQTVRGASSADSVDQQDMNADNGTYSSPRRQAVRLLIIIIKPFPPKSKLRALSPTLLT